MAKVILKETVDSERKKEDTNLMETSTDQSKEEFVKSYSLRPRLLKKDPEGDGSEKSDSKGNVPANDITENENTPEQRDKKKGSEESKSITQESKDLKEKAKDKSENSVDKSAEVKKSSNMSSEGKEKSSDVVDDTENDPDFTVSQSNTKDTLTADDTNIPTEQKSKKKVEAKKSDRSTNKRKPTTRKDTSKSTKKKKTERNDENDVQPGTSNGTVKSGNMDQNVNDEDDEDDDNFGYYCEKCSQKFTDWKEMKVHKLDCVKIPRKHICSICNRGFQQKCLLKQHFDFYHTKKPKQFVCEEHKKVYVYKKSLQEHLLRDHSDGNYKYVCDYCGKGFFHLSEFTIHRDSVHLKKKDYMCNHCREKAFTTVG